MVPPASTPSMLALVLFIGIWAGTVRAAPPPNDSLTSAAILDSDVPSTGTTVDATLEAAEPLPPDYNAAGYQGTVWWKWTPVFAGWHEVTTEGSAVDTVLAIWSDNNGAGPLTLVHVNDDAREGGFSRIRFLADGFTSYKIAVASRNASRGAVTLNAFFCPDPISRATAATFTPASVDVTSAGANITADVTLASSPSFQTGALKLYSPAGGVLATATVGPENRVSGNQVSGVYRMVLTVPQGSTAGTYRWGIRMTNLSGTVESSYGREGMTPLPSGVPESVTVINQPPTSDPYAVWAAGFALAGADAEAAADPDHDGMNNWLEYQSGLHPGQGSNTRLEVSGTTIVTMGSPQIEVAGAGDQLRLRVIFLRRIGTVPAATAAQFSDDLSLWAASTQTPSVIASSSTHEAVMVEDEIHVPARPRRYARVSYDLPSSP